MVSAHNIYAAQLSVLGRGHPLWHPEPHHNCPVQIGDVGYMKNGAFCRLFNAARPANDSIQRFGVPCNFVQLDLGVIDVYDAVLEPGPLHSRTISTLSTEVGTPGEILPAEASFHFSCASKQGAILMLETQMIREEAVQSRRLEAYVVQHCCSWHAFARDLEIHIGFGDLMLVTECSKTAAWSSVVYSNSSTEFGLSFSVGAPFSTAGISASRSLEKIGPVERRRSQKRAQAHGTPLPKDHTVFIKAYRVGMRQMYYRSLVALFTKARSSSLAQVEGEGTSGAGSRSPSISSRNSPPGPSPAESSIIGPYEPDFNPSIALLALEMEKNNDPEFVILHDDVWCSMTPDSEGSRLMDEYTEFYFSEEVTNYLNSMLGEIPYDVESPPSDTDESTASDPSAPKISGDDYLVVSRDQQMEMISSVFAPFPDLTLPEVSGGEFTSILGSAYGTEYNTSMDPTHWRFPSSSPEFISPGLSGGGCTSHSGGAHLVMNNLFTLPSVPSEHKENLFCEGMQQNSRNAHAKFERAASETEESKQKISDPTYPYYRISPSTWHGFLARPPTLQIACRRPPPPPKYSNPPPQTSADRLEALNLLNDAWGQLLACGAGTQPEPEWKAMGKESLVDESPFLSPWGPSIVGTPHYAGYHAGESSHEEMDQPSIPWETLSERSRTYAQESTYTSRDWRAAQSSTSVRRFSSWADVRRRSQSPNSSRGRASRPDVTDNRSGDTHPEAEKAFDALDFSLHPLEPYRPGTPEIVIRRGNRPGHYSKIIPRTGPSSRLSREEEIAIQNLVRRGIDLLGGPRRPVQEPLLRHGFARQGIDTNESWRVGLNSPDTLRVERRLLAVAYSIFTQIMGVSSDTTTAAGLRSLVSEAWRSRTSGEREELCRILLKIALVVEHKTE